MQIQLSTEYALHGLLYLAHHQDRVPIQLTEISAATKVKESYLRKLFQQMVRAGLLDAYKGASGGYALRLRPDQISCYDVFKAVEGSPEPFRCLSEQRTCEARPGCTILSGFAAAFAAFSEQLQGLTLSAILTSKSMKKQNVSWLEQTVELS